NAPAAGQLVQLLAEGRLLVERDLLEREAARSQQRLRPHAVAAPACRVDPDRPHVSFNAESGSSVPGRHVSILGAWPARTRPMPSPCGRCAQGKPTGPSNSTPA